MKLFFDLPFDLLCIILSYDDNFLFKIGISIDKLLGFKWKQYCKMKYNHMVLPIDKEKLIRKIYRMINIEYSTDSSVITYFTGIGNYVINGSSGLIKTFDEKLNGETFKSIRWSAHHDYIGLTRSGKLFELNINHQTNELKVVQQNKFPDLITDFNICGYKTISFVMDGGVVLDGLEKIMSENYKPVVQENVKKIVGRYGTMYLFTDGKLYKEKLHIESNVNDIWAEDFHMIILKNNGYYFFDMKSSKFELFHDTHDIDRIFILQNYIFYVTYDEMTYALIVKNGSINKKCCLRYIKNVQNVIESNSAINILTYDNVMICYYIGKGCVDLSNLILNRYNHIGCIDV